MVLKFSETQLEAFAAPVRAEWASNAAQRLHKSYEGYYRSLGVQALALEPLCLAVEQWAGEHGVVGQRDVAQLCCVASALGHRFWDDPRFSGYVSGSIANNAIERGHAVGLLLEHTRDWLAVLWQNDSLGTFGGRLGKYVQQNLPPNTRILADILPGHWQLFDAPTNEEVVVWILKSLPPDLLPAQRLAYVACALAHGTGWGHDPQYFRILRAVRKG